MTKRFIIRRAGAAVALGLLSGFFVAERTATPAGAQAPLSTVASSHSGFGRSLGAALSSMSQAAPGEKTVEQAYQNIKVLNGMPESQLLPAMNLIRVSLGVRCEFCHVRTADGKFEFAKDDKREKETAREMIRMVININHANFGGQTSVSCYTCHQGHNSPVGIPPVGGALAAVAAGSAGPAQASAGGTAGTPGTRTEAAGATPRANALPAAEQLVDKYTQAIGGAAAIERLKTRIAKGTYTATHGPAAAPVEIYQEAPNKFLAVATLQNGPMRQVYNGTSGWASTTDAAGGRPITGAALLDLKRRADFFIDLRLKDQFSRMRTVGKEKIGDRDAYVVRAFTADRRLETLYFDTQTGLLLRRIDYVDSIIGRIPRVTDFDDYRDAGGVKVPFSVQRYQLEGFDALTLHFSEVRFNAPIDEAQFSLPGAAK